MREDRWNTSVARPLTETTPAVQPKQKSKPRLKEIGAGEKLLYLSSVVVGAALLLAVTAQFARLNELNYNIAQTKQAVRDSQQDNFRMKIEEQTLGSASKVRQFVQSHGLVLKTPTKLQRP